MRDPTKEAEGQSGQAFGYLRRRTCSGPGAVGRRVQRRRIVNESSGVSDSPSGTLDTKLRARNEFQTTSGRRHSRETSDLVHRNRLLCACRFPVPLPTVWKGWGRLGLAQCSIHVSAHLMSICTMCHSRYWEHSAD